MKGLRRQWTEEIYVKILQDITKESKVIIKVHKVTNTRKGQARQHYFS